MKKIDKISEKVMRFSQLRYIKIIMNAFLGIAAFSIGSSFFSLLRSIPIPAYQSFLNNTGLTEILNIPILVVSNLFAVLVVISIGYEMGKNFEEKPLPAAMVSFGAFMILTPFVSNVQITNEAGEQVTGLAQNIIPLQVLGAQGIFLAMICGIIASRIYIFLMRKNIKLKLPESLPPSVSTMFETMIPAGIVFIIFMCIRVFFRNTQYQTAQNFIYGILQQPLMLIGGTPIGAAFYLIVCKLLWMFGIHGDMLTYATLGTILTASLTANIAAFAAGTPVPYLEWGLIVPLMNVGILGLTLLLLLISKSERFKTLGKLSIATSIFNITEPVMFGFPIVMNPIMAIPAVLGPGLSLILTAFVMKIGIVAPITGASLSSVLPVPIFLWMATNSITGLIWGCVIVLFNSLIFFPFFKIAENNALKEEREYIQKNN